MTAAQILCDRSPGSNVFVDPSA